MIASPKTAAASENGDASLKRSHQRPARGQFVWRILRRLFYTSLLGLTSAAVILLLSQWTAYRMNNVVTHAASVKGVVTQIGSRLEGRVAKWHVAANQQVAKNQILAELENAHLKAAVAQAEAEVAQAEQELKVAQVALTHQENKFQAELALAQEERGLATHESTVAKHTLNRWRKERKRAERVAQAVPGSMPGSERDAILLEEQTAQSGAILAQVQTNIAKRKIELAESNVAGLEVEKARIKLLEQNIQLVKTALEAAQVNLDSTIIRAPEEGCVVQRVAEVGASVKVGEPIATVWVGGVWLDAWVDESQLAYLRVGEEVDVYLSAYPEHQIVGKVDSLGVMSDVELRETSTSSTHGLLASEEVSSKLSVRINLPNNENLRFLPGLTARVGIRAPEKSAHESDYFSYLRSLAMRGL